jgi:hypothetical protein
MQSLSLLRKLCRSSLGTRILFGSLAGVLACCLAVAVRGRFQQTGHLASRPLPEVALEIQNVTPQPIVVKRQGSIHVLVPHRFVIPHQPEDSEVIFIEGRYELMGLRSRGTERALVIPPKAAILVDAKIRALDQSEINEQASRIPVEGWSAGRLDEDVRVDIGLARFTDLPSQLEQLFDWGQASLEFEFETVDGKTLSSRATDIPFNRLDISTNRWTILLSFEP